jgi:hypothetical protein
MIVAEPAWRASLRLESDHQEQVRLAKFVPRARKWFVAALG